MSNFAFLKSEWSDIFESASKAEFHLSSDRAAVVMTSAQSTSMYHIAIHNFQLRSFLCQVVSGLLDEFANGVT